MKAPSLPGSLQKNRPGTSKVILFRNLPQNLNYGDIFELIVSPLELDVSEKDLVIFFQTTAGSAFIEFPSLEMACQALHRFEELSESGALIGLHGPMRATFSNKAWVNKDGSKLTCDSRVLLVTVSELMFEINLENCYELLSMCGKVCKLCIFTSTSTRVQILVEYDSLESCDAAFRTLHDKYMYDNANLINVQVSKHQNLTIRQQYPHAWDFTKHSLDDWFAMRTNPQDVRTTNPRIRRIHQAIMNDQNNDGGLTPKDKQMLEQMLNRAQVVKGETLSGDRLVAELVELNPARRAVLNLAGSKMTEDQAFRLFSTCGQLLRIQRVHKSGVLRLQFSNVLFATMASIFFGGTSCPLSGRRMAASYCNQFDLLHSDECVTRSYRVADQRFPVKDEAKYLDIARAPTTFIQVSYPREDFIARMDQKHGITMKVHSDPSQINGPTVYQVETVEQAMLIVATEKSSKGGPHLIFAQP